MSGRLPSRRRCGASLLSAVIVALLVLPLQACARSGRKNVTVKRPVSLSFSTPHQLDLLRGAPLRIELRARAAGRGRIGVSAVSATGTGQRLGLARLSVSLGRRTTKVLTVQLDAAAQRTIAECDQRRIEVSVSPAKRAGWKAASASHPLVVAPPGCGRFFSPTAVWNVAPAPDAPLDPDSSRITAELNRQVEQGFNSTKPPWINTTSYSTPIYTVRRDQHTVRVKLDSPYSPELQRAWEAVPLPVGASPAPGTDRHLVVWQPSTDTMWEFWQLSLRGDGWHANWGGRMRTVSQNPGFFTAPFAIWGATATSLPLMGGLMTLSELQRGHIDHALAISVPDPRAKVFAWPAQRTDGRATNPYSIPEGARFRLDPSLNIDALGLPPIVHMIAVAAQRYGLIVRDRGSIAFFGQVPAPDEVNPYPALLGNLYPSVLLRRFPWDRLQLLRMQLSTKSG